MPFHFNQNESYFINDLFVCKRERGREWGPIFQITELTKCLQTSILRTQTFAATMNVISYGSGCQHWWREYEVNDDDEEKVVVYFTIQYEIKHDNNRSHYLTQHTWLERQGGWRGGGGGGEHPSKIG